MMGTNVGAAMQSRSRLSSWCTPTWREDETAGGVTPGEGQLLYGLVRALRPDVVIEVGTGYGHSTLHLAAGVRDNSFGHVYTVEIDDGRRSAATGNIAEAGLSPYVTQSDEIPPLAADLVFLDAGHLPDDVRAYMDAIDVEPSGVVVIHDAAYLGHAVGVAQEGGWNIVHLLTDSLAGLAILGKGEPA